MRVKMALPRSDFRLSVRAFLLAFSRRKKYESRSARSERPRRAGSPVGGSILITSAPSHASISVQLGPASYWVRSSTLIPSSAFAMDPPRCSSACGPDGLVDDRGYHARSQTPSADRRKPREGGRRQG